MPVDFIKLLRVIEENRMEVFSTSELANVFGLSTSDIQNYLETLANNELIHRIEKGKYCRIYIRDKFVIGSQIVHDGVVSHQSALAYHGIGEDIEGQVFISSSHQKNSKSILGNQINFIRIRPHKNFGFLTASNQDGSFRVSDTEKTLLDCFDLPKYVSSYQKLISRLPEIPVNQEKLLNYGLRMKNLSVLKRLAYLIESHNSELYPQFMEGVQKVLNSKYTLLDPRGEDIGPFVSKWRIRDNVGIISI